MTGSRPMKKKGSYRLGMTGVLQVRRRRSITATRSARLDSQRWYGLHERRQWPTAITDPSLSTKTSAEDDELCYSTDSLNQSSLPAVDAVSNLLKRRPSVAPIIPAYREALVTLVAMPAYNEEKYIAKTIIGAQKYADKVLVVDDGSHDGTAEIAEALGTLVIKHKKNRGYGGALQTIFATARELNAQELVIIDSDGQHNPGDIQKLLHELRRDGADVVIGSRFIDGNDEGIPAYRKIGMKVLDKATKIAGTNLSISDSQSGFRAYGRRAIEAIKLNGDGMSAGSEILIQISDHRLKVAEVPIKVRYDIEGTSSQNPVLHGVSVLLNLIRLMSIRRPYVFFGIPGLLLTGFSVAAEIFVFSQYMRTGDFHYLVFTGSFSILIIGLMCIIAGFISHSPRENMARNTKRNHEVL